MKTKRILSAMLATVMLVSTLLAGVILPSAADEKPTHVTDGLVSLYKGADTPDATVWEDSVGDNDLPLTKNNKNYLAADGLHAEGAQHYFPQAIVDLVNSNAFTVEIFFGDFTSIGRDFNTFMNSANDNFALFRRNSNDNLEFKWAGRAGDLRPKAADGLSLIDNGVISVTFEAGGSCCIYVDGTIVSKVSTDTTMGADNLFIGHAQDSKLFSTVYKSIRFYDRVLTPEEVANNARADGVTVVDPGEKPKTFITVAQPKTNIVGDISMIREVNSKAEMDAMTGAKALPATAVYTVNSKLEALDAEGKAFATVAEILAAHDYKILPAFRVADKATADALAKHLKDIRFYDVMVVSADPAVVKDFRTTLPQVTAAIDYTETYKDTADLSEEQLLDIRRSIKINNGTVAILPASLCRNEDVQYLYNRQVNVWAKTTAEPTEAEQYSALLSGAIGVISDSTDSLLTIACTKLPANTTTRVTLNIGHRGIPASAPENTVEGSLHAFEQGANVIELDIYLSQDGEIVVMHDGTTGRTCNKDISVEGSTLAQLKELYVNKGYENNARYRECRIPTLKEYLEAFKDKDCQLFIEIKSGKTAIVSALKACIDEYDMYDQCSVITFNEPIMAAMRKDYPEMSVGALCDGYMAGLDPEEDLRSAMTFIGKYNATLNPSYGGYEANDIRAALQRGISIYPWTFRGDINTYKSHLLWGYSGLTGDNANVFRRIARNIAYTPDSSVVEPNSSVTLELDITYYNHESKAEAPSAITILSGEEFVTLDGNTMTFQGMGEVTFYMSYEAKVGNSTIMLHTQPTTLTTFTEQPVDPEVTTEVDTTAESTVPSDTAASTDTAENSASADGENTTSENSGGCGSTLCGMALLLIAGMAVVAMKKKEE